MFSFLTGLLDLVYPPKCVFCGGLLEKGEEGICGDCAGKLEYLGHHGRFKGEFFEEGFSCFGYGGDVRHSIHRFKFGGHKEYAAVYAKCLAEASRGNEAIESCDIVTSTPTNARNIKKRGYDHSALLARDFAKETGMTYLKTLVKTRETEAMFGLKPDERRANIMGAIDILPVREQIEGKTVLLIDDIFTTGATAGECARVLRTGGAGKVFVLTVAKTEK